MSTSYHSHGIGISPRSPGFLLTENGVRDQELGAGCVRRYCGVGKTFLKSSSQLFLKPRAPQPSLVGHTASRGSADVPSGCGVCGETRVHGGDGA